jgi:PPOX class probable FMN-dependent enzyme
MNYQITSEDQLREMIGEPVHPLVVDKSTSVLSPSIKKFIEMSPFAALATHAPDGSTDISPRGDPPGWVHIKDEKTLVLPERPGNKRLDSVINIIKQPKMSLLFMIPNVLETVRVNGSAIISSDPDLLSLFPINGKLPEIAIVVTIEEALGHCSKAYRRSKLWENDYKPNDKVPTLAELMSDHLQLDLGLSKELDDGIASDVRERMY